MAKGKVTINEARCKGCGLCVDFCPKKVLALDTAKHNEKGYHPAHAANPQDCIGCAMCATMCPDCAITVEREAK
ncbi:MAG: 4Fe-4S binding protein [Oscillospiraceae bacterium]|nr:4Fe-4S binding protein [Oscillospiraceae bacterium]